jgi:LuxR family transcriptional regulator, maltose regulon positive regulatory protein
MANHTSIPPLLQTKLHMPVVQATVTRARLLVRLDRVLENRCTLISAPAGFGKTTLAVDWLRELPRRHPGQIATAWLSLDERDSEVRRFLAYLVAALQKVDPYIGRGLQEVLQSPDLPGTESLLTALINDVVASTEAEPSREIVLVLDDYHLLDHPQIDEALIFLLDHLPATLHLLLLTRIDPSLPLSRLRAKRQIGEIRERDLRFSVDETEAFITQVMGLDVAGPDIERLHARTEGWVAGLQLAALAMHSQEGSSANFVADLAANHRYIMDYLADEVFHQQPPEIQHFLLRTSILDRICADLADALVDALPAEPPNVSPSQRILEFLERANLFIVPLDQNRRWYRYHHLFGDLLRQRAQQAIPTEIAPLHSRAAHWYATLARATADHTALDAAFHHATAARDHPQTAALLNEFGDGIWERGEHDHLRRWLAALPADMLARHPRLLIFQGWLLLTSGSYAEAEQSLAQAEAILGGGEDAQELAGRIAASRAFLATFQGNLSATLDYAQKALDLLASRGSTWRGSAAIALGDAHALRGEMVSAGHAYAEALAICQSMGNVYLALNAGFKLAGMQRQRGELGAAYEGCGQLIALAEEKGLTQTTMAGCLYGLRGDILCEWNRLPEALAQTQQAVEAAANARHIGFVGWIYLYRIRCLMVARDFAQAEAAFQELNRVTANKLPPWLAALLGTLRALLWLVTGNMTAVAAWVAERKLAVDADIPAHRELEYLTFARLLALKGQLAEAEAILARLREQTRRKQRFALSIPVLITQALLLQAQNKHDAALDAVAEALRLGEAGPFIRSFLDGGERLIPLLKRAAERGTTPVYVEQLLTAYTPPATSPQASGDLPEPLSQRESEVLTLIAEGLKNQEIADRLIISLNTILYHTKNLYGKLGVSHRTQAVQRARELGLLE